MFYHHTDYAKAERNLNCILVLKMGKAFMKPHFSIFIFGAAESESFVTAVLFWIRRL